ncbi:hypothetical protein [Rossellomorea marisflavi]|uniref:hypothetical protein n=1 Tax=Rossellomorea marisflavi TaxID=189381 RepID=UPI003FA06F18
MNGVLNANFSMAILFNDNGEFDKEEVVTFKAGSEVEVLKVLDDKSFISGVACVIFNPENNECLTIDSGFVDLNE